MFGILASTAFTLVVVPLIWYRLYGHKPVAEALGETLSIESES